MEKQSIYLRKVLQSDIKLIFEWANDKDARNNSFKTKEITWAEHETWFENTLKDLKTRHYILCYNGNDIGQIRIKIEEENQGKISYSIDKAYRGLGFGKIILQLCENALLEEFKDFYLYAEVKKSNIASQRIFKTLGYNESIENDVFKYNKKASKIAIFAPTPPLYQIIFLTNNKNSLLLFEWIKSRCDNVLLYSDTLDINILNNVKPKLIISYNYSSIIKFDTLKYAKDIGARIINMHISLLPWNKGSNPNFWSFIKNTPKGVSIHELDSSIDGGKIIYQKEVFFDENKESLKSSYEKLQNIIIKLFQEHWDEIISGHYILKEQHGNGSYHDLKMYNDFLNGRVIDFNKNIIDLKRELEFS